MKIRDEIVAKIQEIQSRADQDKAQIQSTADVQIQELQSVLDANEGWINRDAEVFQEKFNRVFSILRQ